MQRINLESGRRGVAIVYDAEFGLAGYGASDLEAFHRQWGGGVNHRSEETIAGWVPSRLGRRRVLGYSTRTLDVLRELNLPRFGQQMLTAPDGSSVIVPYGRRAIDRNYPVVLAGSWEGWVPVGALHVDELPALRSGRLQLSGERLDTSRYQPEGLQTGSLVLGVGPTVPRRHLRRVLLAFEQERLAFRGELEQHAFWACMGLCPQVGTEYLFRMAGAVAVERYMLGELTNEHSLREIAPPNVQILAADCVLAEDPDRWRIYWRDGARTGLPRAEADRLRAGGDRGFARMLADHYRMGNRPDEGKVVTVAAQLWHEGWRKQAERVLERCIEGPPEERDALIRGASPLLDLGGDV